MTVLLSALALEESQFFSKCNASDCSGQGMLCLTWLNKALRLAMLCMVGVVSRILEFQTRNGPALYPALQ
jgi:hypothetical protein